MGVPSVFLRTFGCNFKCAGFGMARGVESEERLNVDAKNYTEYNSLPLVSTGCDSYASWDPRFKHLSPVRDIDNIVNSIMELLPYKTWREEHLIITGGEPLLGWQRQYQELLDHPLMEGLMEITFETNGTQALIPEFFAYLQYWTSKVKGREVTFSVSAKLPCSGHTFDEAIKPNVVTDYAKVGTPYLKFVVANEQDIEDAEKAVDLFRNGGFKGFVYLMPIGGVESVYNLNAKNVALAALARGWRYSDRLQVPLFKNAWAT